MILLPSGSFNEWVCKLKFSIVFYWNIFLLQFIKESNIGWELFNFNSIIITYICKYIKKKFSHTVRQLIVLKIQLHAHKVNHAPRVYTSVSELFLGP